MYKFLVVVLLMFASTSCFASDWIVLYIEDMGKTYYDKSSITRHGNIVSVDFMTDYNNQRTDENGSYYSIISKYDWDCYHLTYNLMEPRQKKSDSMGRGKTVPNTEKDIRIVNAFPNMPFDKEDIVYKVFCIN